MVTQIVFHQVPHSVCVYIGYILQYFVSMNVETNHNDVPFLKQFFLKLETLYVDLLQPV